MGRQRAQFDVSLKALIDHGKLNPGSKCMVLEARSKTRKGDLKQDGTIHFEGKTFTSASSFAVAALRSAGAKTRMTANGWQLVTYLNKPLETYRAEYIRDVYGVKDNFVTQPNNQTPASPDSNPSPPVASIPFEKTLPENNSNTPPQPTHHQNDTSTSSSRGEPAHTRNRTTNRTADRTANRTAETSSDEATVQRIEGGGRKRARAPRPELQMWLKKALKKRHVESQAMLANSSS